MKNVDVNRMAESFQNELQKIAASVTFQSSPEAGKLLAAAAAGAMAALFIRKANRDQKMGRLMRLQDELQADSVS